MSNLLNHPASYRDPSGFVFQIEGKYYRQVNQSYASDYDHLKSSGLYRTLIEKKILIEHQEIEEHLTGSQALYKTLFPTQLTFISYPYEWSFDQLKDAALLTLRILKIAVNHGMILKDATPYNVQFYDGKPIFIDTLSFEKHDPAKPWIAYRQFCECFLFPLLLEHYLVADMQKLLAVFLDGIPVKTTASLLPARSKLKMSTWLHVYLQQSVSGRKANQSKARDSFSKEKLIRLIDHLKSSIHSLNFKDKLKSTWNNYYSETILSKSYLSEKEKIFRDFLQKAGQGTVLDLGANDGYFSSIAAERNPLVIAADFDSKCINRLYLSTKEKKQKNIIPICIDISNPSPALGFRNAEREPFLKRAKSETVLALALIHHLVLSKNIPLADLAEQFMELTHKSLIIEFVPIQDEKAQQLIENKSNYHMPYDPQTFEERFNRYFSIEKKALIPGTDRILYMMKKR
ncbi:MAG: hypothetical protein ACHQET_01005 [Chitinophagales bacterium]